MRKPQDRKRIVLAHIFAAHGIRGDVMARAFTGDPADLDAYGPLSDATGARRFEIKTLRVTPKGVVLHFKGIDDRNAAEALRGLDLYVERSALPPAEDGAYYHVDLIGLKAESPSGEPVGTITAVQNFGAGEMLEIRMAAGGGSEYVPFTDTYVPTVDMTVGRVVVIMPTLIGDPEPAADHDEEE